MAIRLCIGALPRDSMLSLTASRRMDLLCHTRAQIRGGLHLSVVASSMHARDVRYACSISPGAVRRCEVRSVRKPTVVGLAFAAALPTLLRPPSSASPPIPPTPAPAPPRLPTQPLTSPSDHLVIAPYAPHTHETKQPHKRPQPHPNPILPTAAVHATLQHAWVARPRAADGRTMAQRKRQMATEAVDDARVAAGGREMARHGGPRMRGGAPPRLEGFSWGSSATPPTRRCPPARRSWSAPWSGTPGASPRRRWRSCSTLCVLARRRHLAGGLRRGSWQRLATRGVQRERGRSLRSSDVAAPVGS